MLQKLFGKIGSAILALMLLLMPVGMTTLTAEADNTDFATNRTDFRDESIYFVITTRFYDGDQGNNVLCWDNQSEQINSKDPCWRGDFEGLIDRLDYIKALGFTAIWITPIVQNASGYDYHGYHASDFSKVDVRYQGVEGKYAGKSGDEMFQELVKQAHAKGIKIVLDIVLNHTGNFGEAHFMPEFTRDSNIKNQASAATCMIPTDTLPSNYSSMAASSQYQTRLAYMKNTDGTNHDSNNYWHHVGNSWNWDEPTRWWGQIAGDCVDLNTENPAVDDYLVECYGKFIRMGVDGFRIDTSGHIAPLSFNSAFIPKFQTIANETESQNNRKMNGIVSPFYMYGEVCARYSGVTYRDQPILSPYYYTWASNSSLISQWKQYDASWWSSQTVKEGADPLGNMITCTNDDASKGTSNNAWLSNGAYHKPDYSSASGFNVIDFPVHYNFTSVGSVWGLTDQDNLYNDATWNVVYVDSHDYGPQPSDGIRFSGGTNQWAENMTWMFFFRGIPCLYYGSEVEFQAGKKIDNGANGPLSDTGRAYFGQNLEGSVSASDFGQFTASGQVAKTLNHPLAKHLERLNRIRQAVPALRKGQYAKQTSTSGWAWSKAYNANGENSYVCVAQQAGSATFNNIPNGTYTDCVTGDSKTVTNGSLTVSCPTNQGNARVYVLNGPGKIGEDGPFLYTSSPSSYDNSSLATDEGASKWIGPDDATSSDVKTDTTTTEPTDTTSDSKVVSGNGIKVYVKSSKAPYIYVWYYDNATKYEPNGDWNNTKAMTQYSKDWYVYTAPDNVSSFNFILTSAAGGSKYTGDITNITSDTYYSITDNSASVTSERPDTTTTPADTTKIHAYFINDAGWNSVYSWAWIDNGSNFTGGSWPGVACTKLDTKDSNGYDIWEWTYSGSLTEMPAKIIFNNGGNGEQTADLIFENGAYYNKSGRTTYTPIVVSIKGDVNGDGVVDKDDVQEVLDAIGTTDSTYDLNDDGKVDIFDVQFVLDNM